jgi:uncharacterized protein involved in response to NO
MGPTVWHAHEMIYGFAGALIAWEAFDRRSPQRPVRSGWLIAAAGAWLAGRIGVYLSGWVRAPWLAAVDLAFLPVLALWIRPSFSGRREPRSAALLFFLGTLCVSDLLFHYGALAEAPGVSQRGLHLAIHVLALGILALPGRPGSGYGSPGEARARGDAPGGILGSLAIASAAAFLVGDFIAPQAGWVGVVALASGALQAAWIGVPRRRRPPGEPSGFLLRLARTWLAAGYLLVGLAFLTPMVHETTALHAITGGGIGTVFLAMAASRWPRGPGGRGRVGIRPGGSLAVLLLSLAVILRVGAPLVTTDSYSAFMLLSGLLWGASLLVGLAATRGGGNAP